MQTIREIEEGESVPWYYGFAWRNYTRNTTVVVIIPFNWIAMWLRRLWFMTREGKHHMEIEFHSEYRRGYRLGLKQGKKEMYDEFDESLLKGMEGLVAFMDKNKEHKRYFSTRSND